MLKSQFTEDESEDVPETNVNAEDLNERVNFDEPSEQIQATKNDTISIIDIGTVNNSLFEVCYFLYIQIICYLI